MKTIRAKEVKIGDRIALDDNIQQAKTITSKHYTISQQLLNEVISGLKTHGGVATDFTVRKLQELTPVNDDH